jgi:hypothetical protein
MSELHIKAVSLNHNTSLFTELMARSLLQRNRGTKIDLTVYDNSSNDDPDLSELRSYLSNVKVPFLPSGFGLVGNVHGLALQRFVADNPTCTHYLFIDPDVYFMAEAQIQSMARELVSSDDAWCLMPRCTWDGKNDHTPYPHEQAGASIDYEITWPWGETSRRLTAKGVLKERVHPFCVLIKNTEAFRAVAREIGLCGGFTFCPEDGAAWDTMGLATSAMRTHGLRELIGETMVFHFFNVSYDTEWIDSKRQRCRKWLEELRA